MEGWLTKQAVSATFFKNWRRRWITLTPQCITWHRTGPPLTTPPAGSLEIKLGTHLAFSDARRHCIAVRTGTRELLLEARDAREMQRWYDALNEAVSAVPRSPMGTPRVPFGTPPRGHPTSSPLRSPQKPAALFA